MPSRDVIRRGLRVVAGARRLSLYLVVPALSAIAPLIAIPAITSRYGATGWAVVAVAVSVGATGGVICDLGWGIVGPQEIARDPGRATRIYTTSLGSKFVALLIVLPLSVVLAVLLTDGDKLTGALVAAGTLLTVMSPAWFFIGQGRPGLIMLTDTVPRLVLCAASALAIAAGGPLVLYGIGVLASSVGTMVVAAAVAHLPLLPSRSALREGPGVIRRQLPIIVGNIVSTAFTSAPTSILAQFSTANVIATFSAVDRPMRMGLNVLGGVPARLQSWVGTPDPHEARRRSKHSILINAGLGVVALVGFVVAAPPLTKVLFSGTVDVTLGLAVLGGVIAAEICLSRGLGLALVASGKANSISIAVAVGAVVGVALLLLLPRAFGVAGALEAIIAAEAAMIVVQLVQLRAAWVVPVPQDARAAATGRTAVTVPPSA